VGQGVVREEGTPSSLRRSAKSEAVCGAEPDDKHASWCLATEDDYDEILGTAPRSSSFVEDDPLAE